MGTDLITKGLEWHKKGDITKAQALYLKALNHQPNNIDALYLSALAYSALGNLDEAYRNIKKGATLSDKVEIHKLLGDICLKKQNLQESLQAYQQADKILPNSDELLCCIGYIYQKMNMPQEAIQYYERSIKINPENPITLANVGIFFKENGYFKESLEYLHKATEINPKDILALQALGESYNALKEFDKAAPAFLKIKKLMPNDIEMLVKTGNEVRYKIWMDQKEKEPTKTKPKLNIHIIEYEEDVTKIDWDKIQNEQTHICFMEKGDSLHRNALSSLSEAFCSDDSIEAIYTDEDVIDEQGQRSNPHFKTQFAPYLLLSQNYMDALLCLKITDKTIEHLKKIETLSHKSLYELVINLTYTGAKTHHIADVLYHRLDKNHLKFKNTPTNEVIKKQIQKHNLNANLVPYAEPGFNLLKFYPIGEPKVSIIIPFKDKLDLTKVCVESIEQKTTYKNYEILLVDNRSEEAQTLEYLNKSPHTVIKADIDFNFAQLNNIAAKQAKGDFLVFLNNDMKIITPDWVESTLGLAQRDNIGMVGAKLIRDNETNQHAGIVYTKERRQTFHVNNVQPKDFGNYMQYANLVREYSCVTGAFIMVAKKKFTELGMFDERYPVVKNDIDLCFKASEQGYYNIYNPNARIYHFESLTRKSNSYISPESEEFFQKRWDKYLSTYDPYYSPNMSTIYSSYVIRTD